MNRLHRCIFTGLLVLGLLLSLELTAAVGLRIVSGDWPSLARLEEDRQSLLAESGRRRRAAPAFHKARSMAQYFGDVALHPFLGFVMDPGHLAANLPGDTEARQLGFPDNLASVLQQRSPDKVIVGIFGGSMANILADVGRQTLVARLGELRRFQGKKFIVVSVAMGGFKQPQQLMALNYLLTLGGSFDVIINLDGFNEVALPPAEMIPQGVFPLYPRNWFFRVSELDPALRRAVGRQSFLGDLRRQSAREFARPLPRRSLSAGLIWKLLDRWLAGQIAATEASLLEEDLAIAGYQVRGPQGVLGDVSDPYETVVGAWRRASLQMARLCAANDIEYYHFLQPNQYVEGSKPLSGEERKIAWREDHKYRPGVVVGYPLLIAAGVELQRAGVAFHDLTGLFTEVEETLYIDDCCHVGVEGNRRLAEAITKKIM